MKAFVSGSNNEFFGNFEIQSEQELTEELKKFLVSNPMVPKFSYIEMESKTWTIVNLDPLQLVSGIIREEIVKNKKNNTNRKKKRFCICFQYRFYTLSVSLLSSLLI